MYLKQEKKSLISLSKYTAIAIQSLSNKHRQTFMGALGRTTKPQEGLNQLEHGKLDLSPRVQMVNIRKLLGCKHGRVSTLIKS